MSVMPVFKLSDETLLVLAPGGVISLPPGTSPDEAVQIGRLTASMQEAWKNYLRACREVPEKVCNPPDPKDMFGVGFDGRAHETAQYRTWMSRLTDGRRLVWFDEGNGWWYPLLMLPPGLSLDKALTIANSAVVEDAFLLMNVLGGNDADGAPIVLAVPWNSLHLALQNAMQGREIVKQHVCTAVVWPANGPMWLTALPDFLAGGEEDCHLAKHNWAIVSCFHEDLAEGETDVDCPQLIVTGQGIYWDGDWGNFRVETSTLWLEQVK